MSGISAENLARLTSASEAQKDAALEAVLNLVERVEADVDRGLFQRSSGLLARQFRLAVEEKIS